MLRWLFSSYFMLIMMVIQAQHPTPLILFSGQVLGPDSIPVENAYLVNYRTLRAYATNAGGRFRIPFQTGDSLKLVHISYRPEILKASVTDTTIIVCFEENAIEMVTVKAAELELQYFNKNMDVLSQQIKEMSHYNYRNTKIQNPYNTNQFTGSTGIAISDIILLFKKKK